jgi:hypothetical protein
MGGSEADDGPVQAEEDDLCRRGVAKKAVRLVVWGEEGLVMKMESWEGAYLYEEDGGMFIKKDLDRKRRDYERIQAVR